MPVTMMMNGAQTSMTAAAGTLIGAMATNKVIGAESHEELRQEQFKEAESTNTFAGGLPHPRS